MLDGLLVLEPAGVLAGPSVGQFLAELGARVIKIEPVGRGDVTRSWRLDSESQAGFSAYFASCNFGKESVALDLKSEVGRDLFQQLADRADVVLCSFRPGAAEKLGADYPTLSARNGRLIYGQITGYGETSRRAGYDAVIQAESGFMHLNGTPEGGPLKMPVALMDLLAAHQLKAAVLLALLERERTGRGSFVSVSLMDAAASALANQAGNWLHAGVNPQPMGSDHPNIAPYGTVFTDQNGDAVVLAVGTDAQFACLCDVLEIHDRSGLQTNADRVRNRDRLKEMLRTAIARTERDTLLAQLHSAGIPAGAVRDVQAVFSEPEAAALVLESKGARGIRQAVFREPESNLSAPPRLGADTRRVLSELVGIDEPTLDQLVSEGTISA